MAFSPRVRVADIPRNTDWRSLVAPTLLVVVVVVASLAVHRTGVITDPERLGAVLSGFGPFAPLAFVALQAAQVLVAPIPGPALALASGYLFG